MKESALMQTAEFDDNQLERIKCILLQEETLTDAEYRFRSELSMWSNEEEEWLITKAMRWGLFDGFNDRPYSLSGLINSESLVRNKKREQKIENAYNNCYKIGKEIGDEKC